jgi:hypothetical protein
MHKYTVWYVGEKGTPDRTEHLADDIDTTGGILTGYELARDPYDTNPPTHHWDLWAYAPGQWLKVQRQPEEEQT